MSAETAHQHCCISKTSNVCYLRVQCNLLQIVFCMGLLGIYHVKKDKIPEVGETGVELVLVLKALFW